jgi:hypothetical protein
MRFHCLHFTALSLQQMITAAAILIFLTLYLQCQNQGVYLTPDM